MPIRHYNQDSNGDPVLCAEEEWGRYPNAKSLRSLRKTQIGDIMVSTIFLGVDWNGADPPTLWETMVFGGKLDQYQQRHCDKKSAMAGHQLAVLLVKGSLGEEINKQELEQLELSNTEHEESKVNRKFKLEEEV